MNTQIKETWECMAPSPAQVWALGERFDDNGRAKVRNIRAHIFQMRDGRWDWIANTGNGKRWGVEPSKEYAIAASESALANVKAEPRPLEKL